MESNRIKNTKRNIIVGLFVRIVDLIFPFIINTIVIKTLGVEYLGLNSLFASILQVLSLAELGVGSALVYSMYEPIANGDNEKVCALLKLYRNIYKIIGFTILVGGLICLPFLQHLVDGDVPDGISLYILFLISLVNTCASYFLFSYRYSILQATQRTDIRDILILACNFVLNISKIIVLVTTGNYYVFCALVPCFTVISNLVIWGETKKRYPQFYCKGKIEKDELVDISKRVFGLFINRFCNVLCNSFDSIIISSFLGLAILGKYNNYFYVMNAVMILLGFIVVGAIPSIGNSIVKETEEKNHHDFKVFQLGFSWILGWASVCMLCLYQPFITLWVGEEMLLEFDVVILFCVYIYVVKSNDVFMSYRQAAGIWKNDKLRPLAEAFVNLGLNIFLVKKWGLQGVLISTILTLGIMKLVWGSYYLFKEYFKSYKHKSYILKMLMYCAVTIMAALATYLLCNLVSGSTVFRLLANLVICLFVPNLIFFVFYFKLPEFSGLRELMKKLLNGRK